MFGIGKSEEERRREKERKKRGMRKYGQSYLKPSRRGSISCWCTGGSLVILAGCILYAFLSRGKAAGIVGGLSVVSFVIDIYGMYCAVQGFLERDRRYLNCKCWCYHADLIYGNLGRRSWIDEFIRNSERKK